jgi:hypothetical protein
MPSTTPGVNQASQNIVAILDANTFEPLFSGGHVMRATVRDVSKLTSWPVEDGTQRTDHRIVEAVEIDLPVLLTDATRSLFEQLRAAYLEGRDLIVQTKVSSYTDMMITEMPHDETPEQGESIPVMIKLKEVRTVEATFGALPASRVANPAQADTVQKGNQQTSEADAPTTRRASVAYGVFN